MPEEEPCELCHLTQVRMGMTWCGLCYANRRGRGNHKGHVGYRVWSKGGKVMGRFLGKRPEAVAKPSAEPAEAPRGLLGKYPAIWEYLTLLVWEGGKKRQPSTLSVFVEDGVIKVALNDRDLARSCYVSGASLEDALGALEKALESGEEGWRAWKRGK